MHFRVRKRSGRGLGALQAPGRLTWRWQRPRGRRLEFRRPGCSRPGDPRPSSPRPSRPTPASAGPACAAPETRPSGLGRAHRHLSHQKPPPRCWPRGGTRRSAPQEARTRGAEGLCRKCSPGARLVGEGYAQTLRGKFPNSASTH